MLVGLTYDLIDDYVGRDDITPNILMEFDTEHTIQAVQSALEGAGYQVQRIGNIYKLVAFLAAGHTVDIVFNLAEGLWGRSREAQVCGLLEAYRIPYILSDPLTMALCLDKAMTKRVWLYNGLPTPAFAVVESLADLDNGRVSLPEFPLFVKPAHEGSSMGITPDCLVTNWQALRTQVTRLLGEYNQPVLVESFVPGREYTVGVLGNGTSARILGIMSRVDPVAVSDMLEKELIADDRYEPLEKGPLLDKVSELALQAFRAVDCKDAARLDIRLDANGEPQLIEVNALMGLRPQASMLPILARQAGSSFDALIVEILQHALERQSIRVA